MKDIKFEIIIGCVLILLAFAFGRFTAPEKVVTETKIVEVEKKTEDKKTDKQKHKKITRTTVIKPDGTQIITEVITDDVESKTETTKTEESSKSSGTLKEVTKDKQKITVAALGGINYSGAPVPVYGGIISKPILGPIAVGVWGLTDKTFGASLGVSF